MVITVTLEFCDARSLLRIGSTTMQGASGMLFHDHAMLAVLAEEDAQVAAVVVRVLALVGVAAIAFVAGYRVRVGHAVLHGIDIFCAIITGSEEDSDDTGLREIFDMTQNVFGAVVLVVSLRIIHRVEVLVTYRNLPQDCTAMGCFAEAAKKIQVACEIRKGLVVAIP